MKPLAPIFLLILIPIFGICQNKKLTIGIGGTPVFYNVKALSGLNDEYTNKLGYRVGLDLGFRIRPHSTITSGVYFSSLGYKVKYKFISMQPNDPYIPRYTDATAYYLDIPLAYRYNIIVNPKFELYLSAGIVYSALISSDTESIYEDNSIRSSPGYLTPHLFSLQGSLGLIYNINDMVGIELEPNYRFCFKGIDKFMVQRINYFGMTLGIVFTLWKKN